MAAARRTSDADPAPLEVTLTTPDGAHWGGRILAVRADVVELGFRGPGPPLEDDAPARLTFRTSRGDTLSARVRSVDRARREDGELALTLAFEGPGGAGGAEGPDDTAGDPQNRRRAVRVPADVAAEEAALGPYGCEERSVLLQLARLKLARGQLRSQGRVLDISLTGIGVLVEGSAPPFEAGEAVDVTFQIPHRPEPVSIPGRVRHRRAVRLGVRYGIAFDAEALAELQRDLLAYVMERQREELRRRTG